MREWLSETVRRMLRVFRSMVAIFSNEQKKSILVFLFLIVLSIIIIIVKNSSTLSGDFNNDEVMEFSDYKIIVDSAQDGDITVTCSIENTQSKECIPMVISGTFRPSDNGTTISSDDVELIVNGNAWRFELSEKLYYSTTKLNQKLISLFLSDSDDEKKYEYKLLVNFEIDEDSIAQLQEAEKIASEEARLRREKEQSEYEEHRQGNELKEKIRTGCLNSDSFEAKAYDNYSSFVQENRIMDYISVLGPQYTGYGNWYLMRGLMTVKYKTTSKLYKDYTITVACLYEVDTGESKSYAWGSTYVEGDEYNEDEMQEMEANIIEEMAIEKGFKQREVTRNYSTGTCKDGTAAYGSRHAKGAANSCYGHGGWR